MLKGDQAGLFHTDGFLSRLFHCPEICPKQNQLQKLKAAQRIVQPIKEKSATSRFVPFLKHHPSLFRQPSLALGVGGGCGGVLAPKYMLSSTRDFALLLCDKAVDCIFCL